MLNQYTANTQATITSAGAIFHLINNEGKNEKFVFGNILDFGIQPDVYGDARVTYDDNKLYDFKFIHEVGGYIVSFSFRGEQLRNVVEFRICDAENNASVTEKFYGRHSHFMGQVVVCSTVAEAMGLYFDFLSQQTAAA